MFQVSIVVKLWKYQGMDFLPIGFQFEQSNSTAPRTSGGMKESQSQKDVSSHLSQLILTIENITSLNLPLWIAFVEDQDAIPTEHHILQKVGNSNFGDGWMVVEWWLNGGWRKSMGRFSHQLSDQQNHRIFRMECIDHFRTSKIHWGGEDKPSAGGIFWIGFLGSWSRFDEHWGIGMAQRSYRTMTPGFRPWKFITSIFSSDSSEVSAFGDAWLPAEGDIRLQGDS